MKVSTWNSCYRDNWTGLIVPEAFSHPAKVSPGLAKRIFQHCLDQGYLHKKDICCDPFGGIGGFGIFAASMDIQFIGIELEPRFVDLAKQNFALHAHAWDVMGYPQPVILQGDSRRLSQVLREADLICTSPPYSDIEQSGVTRGLKAHGTGLTGKEACFGEYGTSPGQIGNLKSGDLEAVIDGCVMSPPYADVALGQTKKSFLKHAEIQIKKGSKRTWGISFIDNYGTHPAQIGNLKAGEVGAVVTSPPWENSHQENSWSEDYRNKFIEKAEQKHGKGKVKSIFTKHSREISNDAYGQTEGQIGKESSDTYWQACRDVYASCYQMLKPGGVIMIVVKSYVKGGKRVPLPMQTLKLLIHLGFKPLERIKAMLVEETVTQGLFGDIKKVTERKSFFRRLHEKKYPNLKINFEEILVCKKT